MNQSGTGAVRTVHNHMVNTNLFRSQCDGLRNESAALCDKLQQKPHLPAASCRARCARDT
jgi:hypothetical protein